jgi:hypothetical protein
MCPRQPFRRIQKAEPPKQNESMRRYVLSVLRGAGSLRSVAPLEWVLGTAFHGLGNQAAAQQHCERGMALAIDLGASTIKIFGCDQRVRGLANYARTLWLRGFSEKALSMAQQAINEAEHQDHPVSLCLSLTFGSGVFLWTGDLPRANGLIDRICRAVFAGSLPRCRHCAKRSTRNRPQRGRAWRWFAANRPQNLAKRAIQRLDAGSDRRFSRMSTTDWPFQGSPPCH